MKRIFAAVLGCLIALTTLSACKRNRGLGDLNDLATTEKHTQIFTNAPAPGVTIPSPSEQSGITPADNSWKANYKLRYLITENNETSELVEQRCNGIYCVTDVASGAISYFTQQGPDISQYILNPAAKSGSHTLQEGKSLADITSGFMKIAYIDPAFTTYSNVEYQNDDLIAGRTAKKYTQSAYSESGLLTAYAFVWIDAQYGFVSKCQVYNMTGTANTSWELQELTVGGVTAESIGFSTDGYTIIAETVPNSES